MVLCPVIKQMDVEVMNEKAIVVPKRSGKRCDDDCSASSSSLCGVVGRNLLSSLGGPLQDQRRPSATFLNCCSISFAHVRIRPWVLLSSMDKPLDPELSLHSEAPTRSGRMMLHVNSEWVKYTTVQV